jgi:hypothetical protein
MIDRRSLVAATVGASVAGAAGSEAAAQARGEFRAPFIHNVYFWLKPGGGAAERDKIIEGLRKLTVINDVINWHIGVPAGTDRGVVDNSYAVYWMLVFADKAAQDRYQVDPIHEKFVADYSRYWDKVTVYDTLPAKS